MSTQHTPAPWRVIIDDSSSLAGRPSISASDELDCDIVHGAGFVQEFWKSARGDKEIQANARLIAAAPDLLEALQHLMVAHGEQLDYAFQQAQDAIAKATGEKL